MSRTKDKTSKLIKPGNTAERNLKIAQLGDFADSPQFEQAFLWRWREAFIVWIREKRPETADEWAIKLNKEIGEAMRTAISRGDSHWIREIARCVEFTSGFSFRANSFYEFGELLGWKGAQFSDDVRAMIAQEYYNTGGRGYDELKRDKKAFKRHVARKLNRDPGEDFRKPFDRACEDLGIEWPEKPDNYRTRLSGTNERKSAKLGHAKRSKPTTKRMRKAPRALAKDRGSAPAAGRRKS